MSEARARHHAQEVKIRGLRDTLQTRLTGMDRAAEVLHEDVTRVPTEIDKRIAQLKELHETMITDLRRELDQRMKQQQEGVATAFAAAKEANTIQMQAADRANAKMEAATDKRIEELKNLLDVRNKALESKIEDLGSRANRAEGRGQGLSAGWGYLVAGLTFLLVLGGFIVAVFKLSG